MNNKDRNQILILGFILLFVAITALFIIGTAKIPVEIIVFTSAVLKFLVLQPAIVSMYYKVHDMNASLTRFIPIYNEIMILPGSNAVALLLSYISIVVAIGLLFVPIDFIMNVFGEYLAFNYGTFIVRMIVVFLLVNMIIYTIVMCKLMKNIEDIYRKFINSAHSKIFKVYFKILWILPFIRIVPLVEIYSRLYTLTKLNDYSVNASNDVELKED